MWHAPPRVPVEDIADIALEPSGCVALIVGYAAIHCVDLTTMTARVVFVDNRAERRGLLSKDGTRAAVFDQYGPCLHVIELADGSAQTREGAAKQLKRRLRQIGQRCTRSADGAVRIKNNRPLLGDVELRLPAGRFKETRAVSRAPDGRIFVAGQVRTDFRADDARMCLCVFDARGALLGTLDLANRGAPASHVYVKGKLVSIDTLEGMGITVSRRRSSEANAALTRFAPSAPDGAREVVFGRLANGVLGRLDAHAPLGDRAFEHEQPGWIRGGLLGGPLPEGPDRDAADDAAARMAFWGPRVGGARDLGVALNASRHITHLLPEMVSRLEGLSRKAWRSAIGRVGHDLRSARGEAADAVFDAMCARLEIEAAAGELGALIAVEPARIQKWAAGDLALIHKISAAVSGGTALDVSTHAASALLGAALPHLSHLESLIARDGASTPALVARVAEATWPALRTLDLRDNRLDEEAAFALAGSAGLRTLQILRLPASVGAVGRAAVHLSPALQIELAGDHRASLAALLTHPKLDPPLCTWIVKHLAAADDGTLRLEAARLGDIAPADLLSMVHLEEGERIAVVDAEVTGALVTAVATAVRGGCGAVRFERCAIDEVMAARLAGLRDLVFDDCRIDLLGRLLLAGAPGIAPCEDADLVDALGAFLTTADPDSTWTSVVEAGRAHAPQALAKAMNSNLDALAACLNARPERLAQVAEWPETAWSAVLARIVVERADANAADYVGEIGPLFIGVFGDRWEARVAGTFDFTLTTEPRMAAVTKLFSGEDVLTGDAEFDALARIAGAPAIILQALDAPARYVLASLLRAGGRYEDGTFRGAWPMRIDNLAELIRLTLRWRVTPSLDALFERVKTEPASGVRALLIGHLASRKDVDGWRLRPVLEAYALDPDDAVRAQVAPVLWRMVQREPIAALSGEVLTAVLDRYEGDQQIEAVRELGGCGDDRSVPALTKIGTGLFVRRALRDAVKAAIEAIVERTGGLRGGELAVVDPVDGGLAIAPEGEGD